jgi:hypothetical protein
LPYRWLLTGSLLLLLHLPSPRFPFAGLLGRLRI